jgi:hypothetical protein
MANDRLQRLMQESLDEMLSPEQQEELAHTLDRNAAEYDEYSQLERVHQLLSLAPHERAPQRLAATIMARISVMVQEEQKIELETLPSEAVAVALSLVAIVTMPLLVAASWLILNAAADPNLLDVIFQQIIAALLLVINMLKVFLEQAQALVSSNPELAMVMLALLPITLLGIAQYVLGDDERGE